MPPTCQSVHEQNAEPPASSQTAGVAFKRQTTQKWKLRSGDKNKTYKQKNQNAYL